MDFILVPERSSRFLRYLIETLFIIHGETKLNMICPMGGDSQLRYGPVFDVAWCANMHR